MWNLSSSWLTFFPPVFIPAIACHWFVHLSMYIIGLLFCEECDVVQPHYLTCKSVWPQVPIAVCTVPHLSEY